MCIRDSSAGASATGDYNTAVGSNALNDILNIIFLYLIKDKISDVGELNLLFNYGGYLTKIDDKGIPFEFFDDKCYGGNINMKIPFSFSRFYIHFDLLYCELYFTYKLLDFADKKIYDKDTMLYYKEKYNHEFDKDSFNDEYLSLIHI